MKRQRLSPSQEDYLKAILLAGDRGVDVRPGDIVRRLRVTAPSVTEALQNLRKHGLVNYQPYQKVSLTESGRLLAIEVRQRHERLHRFFMEVLLLNHEIADSGACRMEHVVSEEIINRMIAYTSYIKDQAGGARRSQVGFRRFLNRDERHRNSTPDPSSAAMPERSLLPGPMLQRHHS